MLFTEYNLEDDKQVSYEEGMIDGIAKGIAEGEAKGKVETARGMKVKGYSMVDIAEITGLSVTEIEDL
jgi:predicted transposase/invertase (TIGR01784 family)